MTKQHYIFDFDGTLVDSMRVHGEKIYHLFRLEGIEPPPDILNILTPLGDKGSLPYIRAHFPVRMSDEEISAAVDAYAKPRYENDIPLKDGVLDYLNYLKQEGKQLYILTASPHYLVDPCMKRLGLCPLFDGAWSCEEFGTVKSDPALFRRVAAHIGAAMDELVFFDDNRIAVETARGAGLTTVGVFDPTSEKDRARIAAVADRYVDTLDELIGVTL